MKFYEETSFKETPIGKIPKDWGIVRIGDIITYVKGKKPKEMIEECQEDYLPYLSTEYLRDNKATSFVKHSQDVILVDDGDLILLWDGSNAGEFFFGKRGVLSSTMVKIEQKRKKYDQKFLFYLLKAKESFLKGQTEGTGIPHVGKVVLSNIIIPYPSFAEQQKIAEALSIVDEAVHKINEIIAKTERLKKGLMQELLTKGIGHKEFKDTEIGKIPKEWQVRKVEDISEMKRGFSYRGSDLSKDPTRFRFLTINDFEKEGGLKLSAEPIYLREDVSIGEEFFVKSNDIFIANTDMSRGFIIGAPLWIRDAATSLIYSMDLTKLILDEDKVNGGFLFYLLSYKKFRQLMKSFAQGTNILHLNHDLVRLMRIPLPPSHEQKAIVEVLSTVDKRLEVERKEKERLLKVKQSLMDLLLTGKIRVKVD